MDRCPDAEQQAPQPVGRARGRPRHRGLRHRYRYTGLRRLVEGPDSYYVVPLGWVAGRDPLYVIPKNDETWIGLMM
ncbi:hypothetical protein GCM10018779_52360 [Streptomyces griseocarneus]|nr:hypothetical protein GCM10018779_52360 [Streptomyces griseocarneus]